MSREPEKSEDQLDYERGQKDGSQATPGEKFIDYVVGDHDSSYGKGFQNGWDNHAPKPDSSPSNDDSNNGSGGCFLTSACVQTLGLPDDCTELTVLRQFRDQYMLATEKGRAEVEEYYIVGPQIVQAISSRHDSVAIYRLIYKKLIVPCVGFIQQGTPASAHQLYKKWFQHLSAFIGA